ncbi:Mu transposase C-terminal domain-containing protein, partial [Pseudomonadota bacterium]
MNSVSLSAGKKVWLKEMPHEIVKVKGQVLALKLIGDEKAPIKELLFREAMVSGDLLFQSPFEGNSQFIWDSLCDDQQERARIIFKTIEPYSLLMTEGMSSGDAVQVLASQAEVSTRTIRSRLKLFNDAGLAGLAPSDKQGGRGMKRLDENVETIIDEKVNGFYLARPGCSVSALMRIIEKECETKGLKCPLRKSVQKRIDQIPESKVYSARNGKHSARSKFHVSRASFPGADFPLAVVQFDHTPLDIMVVDKECRLSIGRPYLTLAIDVYSRMVYGYFLTLQPPSYVSTAMCLLNGIQPKDKHLERYGIDPEDWPIYGLPACIHVDNGKDFRSSHLGDFCAQYQINQDFRPIRTPQYGGHIERLFRTINQQLHELDGTTFSSVHHKGDYKSEQQASLNLDELEEFIINLILEYHLTKHSRLFMPPKLCWEKAMIKGLVDPFVPKDESKMLIDILPFKERSIQKEGVGVFGLRYTDDILQSIRHSEMKGGAVYKIKYDPRDISRVYLLNSTQNRYETLYLSDRRFGNISLVELDQMKRVLKREN